MDEGLTDRLLAVIERQQALLERVLVENSPVEVIRALNPAGPAESNRAQETDPWADDPLAVGREVPADPWADEDIATRDLLAVGFPELASPVEEQE